MDVSGSEYTLFQDYNTVNIQYKRWNIGDGMGCIVWYRLFAETINNLKIVYIWIAAAYHANVLL